jgi:hypothetical protein
MNKPLFGLLLGGFLGIFDGLTALVSAPETAPQIVGIVIGSTLKGLMAGVLIGLFARYVKSLPLTLAFGLFVGAALAFWVAYMQGKYYLEIMLPGSILGLVVGYATQRYAGRRSSTAAAALAVLLLASAAQAAEPASGLGSKAAFETLKGLAGIWDGKVVGSEQDFDVSYEVTSGGSVVLERLALGTDHEMLNAYHLVDGELRVTHYCSMGNQPVMKLDTAASKPGDLVFAFAGGTNFDPAKDGHIHSGRIRLDGDVLDGEWGSWAGGKDAGSARFQAKRLSKADAPASPAAHHH